MTGRTRLEKDLVSWICYVSAIYPSGMLALGVRGFRAWGQILEDTQGHTRAGAFDGIGWLGRLRSCCAGRKWTESGHPVMLRAA
jgi:hypothetical protein